MRPSGGERASERESHAHVRWATARGMGHRSSVGATLALRLPLARRLVSVDVAELDVRLAVAWRAAEAGVEGVFVEVAVEAEAWSTES